MLTMSLDPDAPFPWREYRTQWVNRLPRLIPLALWLALEGHDEVPGLFECDGCTASPDYLWGAQVWPACVIHDWDYSTSSAETSRRRADARFRRNILRCLEGVSWWQRKKTAWAYWLVVRRLGAPHFKVGPAADADGRAIPGPQI